MECITYLVHIQKVQTFGGSMNKLTVQHESNQPHWMRHEQDWCLLTVIISATAKE